jgi:hypothetical protein
VDDVVEDLLADLGNIKAAGDKTKAATLREQMCFEDPLRKEIEARAATFPLGRGLIFPHLKRRGDRYLPELEYPASFNDQTKFAAALRKSG